MQLFRVSSDHSVAFEHESHSPCHGLVLSSAIAATDEANSLAHVDGIDDSTVLFLFGGPVPFFGSLIGVVDRLQCAFDTTVEHTVAAGATRIVFGMSTNVFDAVPLSTAGSVEQASR